MQSEGALPLTPFMLWLNQRHALKAFRASRWDEGHKPDCMLALRAEQTALENSFDLGEFCSLRHGGPGFHFAGVHRNAGMYQLSAIFWSNTFIYHVLSFPCSHFVDKN